MNSIFHVKVSENGNDCEEKENIVKNRNECEVNEIK